MAIEMSPGDLEQLPDRISDMFRGQTIFITGGSGFLGKVLIEKLLRTCPGVKTIYLLLRSKKGKSPHERISDIFNNMLFDSLKKKDPLAIKKCKPIAGDVTEANLGISPEFMSILAKEVDFIFHSAASTRFDDTVRVATRINTRGTQYVLNLARECKNLKVLVHVSTAYAYPYESVLEERAYEPPAHPSRILARINFDMDDHAEDAIYSRLLGDCPNTYTFTKAMAEDLVVREMHTLPAIIVRPSIVCPTLKDPFAGWCNNLQGPMGLFVGAGKGIIRSMYIRRESRADFVPADVVINAMLVSTWVHVNHDKNQRIYNVTGSTKYSKTWEEIIDLGKHVVRNIVPFNGIVWYPGGSLQRSKLVHNICFYLFQLIPAILIDLLLVALGFKPVLYQIQRRIQKGSEMLEYFTTKEWEFNNDKTMGMTKWMNEREKDIYKIDGEGIVYLDYFTNCILGLRRNNLKETDDTLPAAKRHLKIMWFVDTFCKNLLLVVAFYYFYRWILQPIFTI